MHFHRHVGSVFHSCVDSLCVFPQACGSVFHSCVEVLCVFLQVVCVPQSCGGAYVHFHRHVGSVCSTVVWRLSVNFNNLRTWIVCFTVMWRVCVHFHEHLGSVHSTVIWRLCVNFHRHVKSVCSTVVWRACVHFHSHVGSVSFHSYVHGLRTFYRHVSMHFQFLVGGFVGIFHSTSNFSTCKLHYMYIYTLLVYIICTWKRFSVL